MTRQLSPAVKLRLTIRGILITLFVAVALYYLVDRDQSFVIVAPTQTVSVTLAPNEQHVWSLSDAVLCRRLGPEDQATPAQPDQTCDARLYSQHSAKIVDIVWPGGTHISLQGNDETRLGIQVTLADQDNRAAFGETDITNNSFIFFSRDTLGSLGGLVASGKIEIGQLAESGAARLTRGGRYEIREALLLTPGNSLVATGDILPGDLVRITDHDGVGIKADMIVTQSATRLADFDVIATSPPARGAVEITRIGRSTARISTRWIDRLLNDGLPAAVSIFLGLFGASLGIAKSLSGNGREKPEK